MNQGLLRKWLLFVLLVPGLAVTHEPLKVMGTQPNSDVFIILAQDNASQNDLSSGLEAFKQKVKSLEKSINTLNQDLIKVHEKEIDRKEVKFDNPKTELAKVKKDWESWKNKLEENQTKRDSVNDFVINIDNYLSSLEKFLTPLNKDIIQSPQQFEDREKIPQLTEYQKLIFGKNATSSEADGLFGKGTRAKIQEVLKKETDNITSNIQRVESAFLATDTTNLPDSTPQVDGNLSKQFKQLQTRIKILETRVKTLEEQSAKKTKQSGNLNNQTQQPTTEKNSNQTPVIKDSSPENNLTLPGGKNMLVPFIFLIIIGGTVFFALRKLILINKTEKDLSQKWNPGEENKGNKLGGKDQAKLSNIPESLHSSQHHSNKGYHGNISDTRESNSGSYNHGTKRTNPVSVKTVSKKKVYTSPPIEPEENKPNLDHIQSEQDLVALYNNNYQALLNEIAIVTATKQSIEDKREGYDSPIIFTGSDSGNYWVTTVPRLPGQNCCLLPKKNLIINEHNYKAVKYVFNCVNYEERNSNQFTLKKPATVYWDNVTQNFCLHEPGELYFCKSNEKEWISILQVN